MTAASGMGMAAFGIIDNHDDVIFITGNSIKAVGFFLVDEICKQVE